MKTKRIDDLVVLRLDPGDSILESVGRACEMEGIASAAIRGIGSIENPELWHYRIDQKDFSKRTLSGIFEMVSVEGNVSLNAGQVVVHIHVTVTDHEMRAYGGHLASGNCSATAELFIDTLKAELHKRPDDASGLCVFDF